MNIGGPEDVPCNSPMIRFQGPIQANIQPGLWCSCLSCFHRATPREWQFSFEINSGTDDYNYDSPFNNDTTQTIDDNHITLLLITEALEQSGLMVQPYNITNYGFDIKAYAYTRVCAWLDVITLKVYVNEKKNNGPNNLSSEKKNVNSKNGLKIDISIEASSGSTGLAPLWMPCAPIISIIFFWLPFGDAGNNDAYLNTLFKNVEKLIAKYKNKNNTTPLRMRKGR